MSFIKLSLGLAAVGMTFVACGPSEPSSSFPKEPSPEEREGSHVPLGDPIRDESSAAGDGDDFDSCVTNTAAAEAKPVHLVFMFDKSGSMTANGSPKWTSAKAASKAFFESADSKGVHASLSFFPDQESYSCDASAYRTPKVGMTPLPSAALGESLDAQTPNGGTPTRVALEGAIAYGQDVAASEAKDGKVAIVLVTDGLPESACAGSSVGAVKDLASTVATTIPTYVIGVGDELTSLKEIAAGGGTKDAFIVDTISPEQIQQDFLAAINAIKQAAIACDYAIPPPPAGEQLDRERVNVVFKSGGGADTFAYNPSCDGGTGWRYDDPAAPKRIVLCDSSCSSVKTKPGRMEVLFGCATRTSAVK